MEIDCHITAATQSKNAIPLNWKFCWMKMAPLLTVPPKMEEISCGFIYSPTHPSICIFLIVPVPIWCTVGGHSLRNVPPMYILGSF